MSVFKCWNIMNGLVGQAEDSLFVIDQDKLRRVKPSEADVISPGWRTNTKLQKCTLPFHPNTLDEMEGDLVKFSSDETVFQVRKRELYNFINNSQLLSVFPFFQTTLALINFML